MREFMFYVWVGETRVEWRNLTVSEAKTLYLLTNLRTPDGVGEFGWEKQE